MQDKNNKVEAAGEPEPQPSNPEPEPVLSSEPALTPEQTSSQLKQKNKQIKVLETKNKKLQAKYIELFKQQKALKKDWSVLTSLVRIIFPGLQQRPAGKWDADELREMWESRQKDHSNRLQELTDEMNRDRQRIEKQITELTQERIDRANRECRDKVDSITKQLDSFKKNNKNLADQLADFDKKLDAKTDEVSRLTKEKLKLEHQINQLKVKSITDQLQEDKGSRQQKSNIETNQFLALRQQVDDLMLKRDQLRNLLKASKTKIQSLQAVIRQKDSEITRLKQQHSEPIQNGHSAAQLPQLQTKISIESSQQNSKVAEGDQQILHQVVGQDDYIHREYMKNVFIRYMKSLVKKDTTQTEVLLNIILTILRFTAVEREIVNEKKKGWFGLY